jgi:hypothetical protein
MLKRHAVIQSRAILVALFYEATLLLVQSVWSRVIRLLFAMGQFAAEFVSIMGIRLAGV